MKQNGRKYFKDKETSSKQFAVVLYVFNRNTGEAEVEAGGSLLSALEKRKIYFERAYNNIKDIWLILAFHHLI